uniref:Uncharacterized protein n=1 Tax=Hyaloperonospora arabidopsidis (strain Emoy2) TaxID=559515 RepID=M4B4W5_HYAAE
MMDSIIAPLELTPREGLTLGWIPLHPGLSPSRTSEAHASSPGLTSQEGKAHG